MPPRLLRYPGLVRAMREVRQAVQRPMTSPEARDLSLRLRELLSDVRAAAGDAGLTVKALPPASRHAYEYLDSLHLERLSVGDDGPAGPPPVIRVGHLIANRDDLLRQLRSLALTEKGVSLEETRCQMLEVVAEVGVLCERAGVTPASLPDPSRRAYQWMSFLVEPGRLETHLRAQSFALGLDPRARVDLFHLSGIYRFIGKADFVELVLSEAFLDAPENILTASVKLALPHTRKRVHRLALRTYAHSAAFEQRRLQLDSAGGSFAEHTRGVVFDLEAVFAKVNVRMFEGRLTRPKMSWLATTSLREFAHYLPATDLILVSSQLDSPDVPAYVVEHVVHHELLHREVGARSDGRREVFHTQAFRHAERLYPRYAEADAFLEAWARRSG